MKKSFLFTCGDINGIGPEIIIKTLKEIIIQDNCKYIFAVPINIYKNTCSQINIELNAKIIQNASEAKIPGIYILDMGEIPQVLGFSTALSGRTAYNSIRICYDYLEANKASALITAPISKTAFKMAGINFPGHTEMLASWSGTKNFVMTFLSKEMNAALLTIHTPISTISKLITIERIENTLNVLLKTLRNDFLIQNPSIAVLGLNPHAGENGNIGNEEVEIISPILEQISKKNKVDGPFSPDAFFGSMQYKNYDLILGMYHDQILIPFKLLNFNSGVNFTAGLPIIRTSPDHGTAFDIAGKGIAKANSTIEAYEFANIILNNRRNNE